MGKKKRFQPFLSVRLASHYFDWVLLIFVTFSLPELAYSVGGGSVMDTAKVANLSVADD